MVLLKNMADLSSNTNTHRIEITDLKGLPVSILKLNPLNLDAFHNLILIIPGNPGLVSYYTNFITALFKELDDGSTAVWAISHSCHTLNAPNMDKYFINYDPLEVEIEHKHRFLETEVPPNCRITLVGHSIGCYMILMLLQIYKGIKARTITHCGSLKDDGKIYNNIYSKIDKCYFLFPTIERMKDTINGKFLWPILKYFQWPAVFLITLINFLPHFIKNKLTSWIIGRKPVNPLMIQVTNDLLTPKIFSNMLKLAYSELSKVTTLNIEFINAIKEKLVFYFGSKDGWCPLLFRNDLVKSIPDIKNYVNADGIEHAFVLKHSNNMATILAQLIKLDKRN